MDPNNSQLENQVGKPALNSTLTTSNQDMIQLFAEHDQQEGSSKRKFHDNNEESVVKKSKFINQRDSVTGNTQENSRKRKLSDNDVTPKKKALLDNLTMPSEGIKLAEHGNIFQLKLLMLCLWRAAHTEENNQPRYKEFRLATEMPGAEKFDDIAFQYKEDNSDKWKFRLLQAKHKEGATPSDPLPKIKLVDLLSNNDDEAFSLQKYFHSYLKILRRSKERSIYSVFSGSEIEDIIVITNTNFDSNKEESIFHKDAENVKEDALLKTDKQETLVCKLRDEENKTIINKFKIVFENSSDFYKLIELLAHHIYHGKKIEKQGIFKEYYYPLVNEIFKINVEGVGKKKKYFIELKNIIKKNCANGDIPSEAAINIRDALIKEMAFKKGTVKIPEIDKSFGISELPDDAEELNELATKVAEFIKQKKKFTTNDFDKYDVVLAQNVLDIDHKKLRSKFIIESVKPRDNKEASTLGKFKECFKQALNKQTTEKDLRNINIDISENFGRSELSSDEIMLKTLAIKLAEFIKQNKKLSAEDFPNYHVALAEEVIDTKNQTFHGIFINGQEKRDSKVKVLTPEAKKLRRIFLDEIDNQDIQITINDRKVTIKKLDQQLLLNLLNSSRINVSEGFANEFKSENNPTIENIDSFAMQMKQLINDPGRDEEQRVIVINKEIRTKLKMENDEELQTFNDNIKKLAGYVLIHRFDKIRFSTAFLNLKSDKFPGNIDEFRAKLKELLGKDQFESLYEYELKFDKKFNTSEDGELYRKLPVVHSDGDVERFFSKLKFIVNYPNRKEINNLLGPEIKNEFKSLDSEVFQSSYYENLHNWMSDRVGTFYTDTKTKILFQQILDRFSLWTIDGFNKPYFADSSQKYKFEKYNILDEFLLDNKQVLQLICKNLFLGHTRIVQAFQKLQEADVADKQQYTRNFGHIFLYLNQLEDLNFSSKVYYVLENKSIFNLIVIECNAPQQEIEKLYNNLNTVINSSSNKKVIFITTQANDALARKFENNLKYDFEDKTNFNDLATESKDKLLAKKIIFQGEEISLKQLYFKGETSPEQLDQLNIDTETLVQLITDAEIKISDETLENSTLEGAYSKSYETVDKGVLVNILQELSTDIVDKPESFFVISGIDEQDTLITNLVDNNKDQQIKIDLTNKICELQETNKILIADSAFAEKDFKQLYHNNLDRNSYWIHLKDYKFILRGLFYPKFLQRKFAYPQMDSIPGDIIALLRNNNDNIFYFTGINSSEELVEVLKLEDKEDKKKINETCKSKNVIIEEKGGKDKFSELVKKAQGNIFVYWLHIANDKIIWRDVTRSIVSEDELIDTIRNKSSIIIDKPGMGKSTTLSILSKKMVKSHWVIFLTLRDWQEEIAHLPEMIDADAIVKFLSYTNNLNSPLAKNLAGFLLNAKHDGGSKPLLLLFDGFDEIRSYDTRNISKERFVALLEFLKKETKSNIWITAREHDVDRLRETLSIFDIKFKPLNNKLQKQYFHDVWSNYLTLSYTQDELYKIFSSEDNKFQRYYEAMSNAADKILAMQDNDFMGIPLTLRLFAEGFRNKFKKFLDSHDGNFAKDFENLSILDLYQYFIEEKFKIFIREKTGLSDCFTETSESWFREKFIKLHCRLAFKELFGAKETKKLLGIKKPFEGADSHVNSAELSELLNFGIIRSIKKDHYEFLHRTLAEYFVSKILVYILRSKEYNNPIKHKHVFQFLTRNILNDSYLVIKKFLDEISKKDEAFNGIFQAITDAAEPKNLLREKNPSNQFSITKKPNGNEKDLEEVLQKVKGCTLAKNRIYLYEDILEPNGTFPFFIRDELVPSFFAETDTRKLKNTLQFVMKIYGKVHDMLRRRCIVNVYLREVITSLIDHYVSQAEKQCNLDEDFITDCTKKISTSVSDANIKEHSKGINPETLRKYIETNLGNAITDFIFSSQLLTPEMGKAFKLYNIFNIFNREVFWKIILPLSSFKYYSKYSSTTASNIDNVTLLDMFQAFSDVDKHRSCLGRIPLEGLVICMRESLNAEKISEDSFTASIKFLIALENFNFSLKYEDSKLVLYHDMENYRYTLELACESQVLSLLKYRINNPESNFEEKLAKAAKNISEQRPVGIDDYRQASY